jgi:two-component system, chemotaxis family, protein-glutamate methylesterase/glutaminase
LTLPKPAGVDNDGVEGAEPGKIIVLGGSAGAIPELTTIVSGLPKDIDAAIFVVVHIGPGAVSVLPQILDRAGWLSARQAQTGERIETSRIYVATPNRHLIIRPGHVHLPRGPHENGYRPAVDPLFRSAAVSYGPDVIGVILSGNLDDGTEGMSEVKANGGVGIVVEPASAAFPGMPQSAADNVDVDFVLPASEIADTLVALCAGPRRRSGNGTRPTEPGQDPAEVDVSARPREAPGEATELTCPECTGTLWEERKGRIAHFRCRTGHAYSPQSLMWERDKAVEKALWSALLALQEKSVIASRMAERARRNGRAVDARRHEMRSRRADDEAGVLERLLASESSIEGGGDVGDSADELAGERRI